jgi:hypothetical protein
MVLPLLEAGTLGTFIEEIGFMSLTNPIILYGNIPFKQNFY